MTKLPALAFTALLDAFADRTPAPGGGSAAATGCALAAALVEMAARFGTDATASADAERAATLRAQALDLIDRDATAYAPVLEAARAGDTARAEQARSAAAEPPLATARLGAELAELAAVRVATGNDNLTGDALTAVALAEASTRAAAALVAINLAGSSDPRRDEAEAAGGRAAEARKRALTAIGEE